VSIREGFRFADLDFELVAENFDVEIGEFDVQALCFRPV
jgi:hypothetical protein